MNCQASLDSRGEGRQPSPHALPKFKNNQKFQDGDNRALNKFQGPSEQRLIWLHRVRTHEAGLTVGVILERQLGIRFTAFYQHHS